MEDKQELSLKLNFIKTNFSFVKWEETVRKNQENQDLQLVSTLLNSSTAKLCLARINKLLNINSQHAVCIVPSRNNTKQYRLLIQLNEFEIPKKMGLDDLLCVFLNKICHPSDTQNKRSGLYFQWGVANKQITLIAPSLAYAQTEIDVEDWLKNIFEEKPQFTEDFKAKYKEALIVDRQKKKSVFQLKNEFLQTELWPLANVYHEKKLKPQIEEVASQAFLDHLPKEMGKGIGFFISLRDAGRLAQTCRKASLAAIELKKAGL